MWCNCSARHSDAGDAGFDPRRDCSFFWSFLFRMKAEPKVFLSFEFWECRPPVRTFWATTHDVKHEIKKAFPYDFKYQRNRVHTIFTTSVHGEKCLCWWVVCVSSLGAAIFYIWCIALPRATRSMQHLHLTLCGAWSPKKSVLYILVRARVSDLLTSPSVPVPSQTALCLHRYRFSVSRDSKKLVRQQIHNFWRLNSILRLQHNKLQKQSIYKCIFRHDSRGHKTACSNFFSSVGNLGPVPMLILVKGSFKINVRRQLIFEGGGGGLRILVEMATFGDNYFSVATISIVAGHFKCRQEGGGVVRSFKCRHPIVATQLSPPNCRHRIVATELSPPKCRHSIVATQLSPPNCLHLNVATQLSPPNCRHRIVAT